jgi:DNA-binding MarR family transcriptional regulator
VKRESREERLGTADRSSQQSTSSNWTYLSNHGHVLICLFRDSEARLRDIAQLVGITERGVSRVLSELEEVGVIQKEKVGRRNRYQLNLTARLRHPLESHATLADLVRILSPKKGPAPSKGPARRVR